MEYSLTAKWIPELATASSAAVASDPVDGPLIGVVTPTAQGAGPRGRPVRTVDHGV
jgi:hypothetical protein